VGSRYALRMNTRRSIVGGFGLFRVGSPAAAGALAVLMSAAGGCSSYTAPVVEVVDARVAEHTSEGAVVQFVITARNTNAKPLPLREVDYTLELNGETVFKGMRSPESTLAMARKMPVEGETTTGMGDSAIPGATPSAADMAAPGSIQEITIPASIPASALHLLASGSARYRLYGTLTYVTPGAFAELLFDTGVSRPTIGFSREGVLEDSAAAK